MADESIPVRPGNPFLKIHPLAALAAGLALGPELRREWSRAAKRGRASPEKRAERKRAKLARRRNQ